MTISGKYELLRPLSAAGFRSFHARHVMTGQEVMVHFLGPGQRYEPRTATEASGPSPADARAQVLDAGTYEGTQFLVTYPVEDFSTLSEWLESVAPVKRSTVLPTSTPPRGIPTPVPPPALPPRRTELAAAFQDVSPPRGPSTTSGLNKPDTASGSGVTRQTAGFTARFGGPLEPPDPRQQLQLPRQPGAPPPAPAPSQAQSTGSFTAVFGGPGNPAPAPQSFPAPSTRLPGSTSDSGSFSKMFGQNAASARTPVPPTTSPSAKEFNKIFLPEKRASTLPAAPPELGRPQTPPAPPQQVGAFTDMFGGPGKKPLSSSPPTDPIMPPRTPMAVNLPPQTSRPAPPPPAYQPPPMHAAPSQSAFDGATQIFGGPPLSARNAPPAPPPVPSGPGEFTMIMGGGPGGGASPLARQPSTSAGPSAPPAGSGFAVPDFVNVRPPSVYAPQVSAPSVSGASIGAGGFTPPTVRPPSVQAPSMAAPQVDFRTPQINMPPMQMPPAAPAAPAGMAGTGSTFSPLLAALLSCVGTVALLAIIYVLTKG